MQTIPPEQSLIEYPSRFPIKVMGMNVDGFADAMFDIAKRFDPSLQPEAMETRPSSGNKYLGLTLTITATSREQLDEIYRTLSTHVWVKMVL